MSHKFFALWRESFKKAGRRRPKNQNAITLNSLELDIDNLPYFNYIDSIYFHNSGYIGMSAHRRTLWTCQNNFFLQESIPTPQTGARHE